MKGDNEIMMKAPNVDNYIQVLSRDIHTSNRDDRITDKKTAGLFRKLYETLSVLKPSANNKDCYSLWIEAERGTIEDYGDFEALRDFGDVNSYEEFVNMWKEDYPQEKYYYELSFLYDNGYYIMFINDRLVTIVNSHNVSENTDWEDRIAPFIQYLIEASIVAIERLRTEDYNQFITDNVPLSLRTGTIKRCDEWLAYPETKDRVNEGLTDEECQRFAKDMKEAGEDKPKQLLDSMMAADFYHFCSLCYKANPYDCEGLTEKEQYYKFADGRDEDLKDIDDQDPEAFRKWLVEDRRLGGHPWEIMRGGNSTHLSLFVFYENDKYYLLLAGLHRRAELVRSYFALKKERIPVKVHEGMRIADAVLGHDYIGIVPSTVIPKYCDSYFPNMKIISFMRFYNDEDDKELLPYITWQDIPKMELKDD